MMVIHSEHCELGKYKIKCMYSFCTLAFSRKCDKHKMLQARQFCDTSVYLHGVAPTSSQKDGNNIMDLAYI